MTAPSGAPTGRTGLILTTIASVMVFGGWLYLELQPAGAGFVRLLAAIVALTLIRRAFIEPGSAADRHFVPVVGGIGVVGYAAYVHLTGNGNGIWVPLAAMVILWAGVLGLGWVLDRARPKP